MKAELEQLIALQNTDTRIRSLKADIEAIPQRRAEIEKEFDQRAFEIRALETQRQEAQAERARLETEIFDQKRRAERADRNLMSSKNAHEYEAAIREADAARKTISQLETTLLEKMEVIDQAEVQLKERQPEVERLRAEMEHRLKELDEQISSETEEIKTRTMERERIFTALPKQMATLYNRISARIRDGIAVSEARNGSCSACFMSLRPQVMAEIRRGEEVITCDNCSRILYYVPAEQKATESATATPNVAA